MVPELLGIHSETLDAGQIFCPFSHIVITYISNDLDCLATNREVWSLAGYVTISDAILLLAKTQWEDKAGTTNDLQSRQMCLVQCPEQHTSKLKKTHNSSNCVHVWSWKRFKFCSLIVSFSFSDCTNVKNSTCTEAVARFYKRYLRCLACIVHVVTNWKQYRSTQEYAKVQGFQVGKERESAVGDLNNSVLVQMKPSHCVT